MTGERRAFLIKLGSMAGIVSLAGVAGAMEGPGKEQRRQLLSEGVIGAESDMAAPTCPMEFKCNIYCDCHEANYGPQPPPQPGG